MPDIARRLLRCLPALAWMASITWLSGQSWLSRGEGELGPLPEWIVPKAAHVLEYAVLGFLLAWALKGRRPGLAAGVACLFALSDEWHQSTVPGREGRVLDVAIDALGVVVGVWGHARWRRHR